MKRFVIILSLFLCCVFFATAQKRSSNVELYPVPLNNNDKLNVRLKPATAGKAKTVELRNFIGKKLQLVKCNGNKELSFSDMQQYPEGVYVVLIKDVNGKIEESVKFLITK